LRLLSVAQVYRDRDQFASLVREVAAPDVGRMGIEILSFTIKGTRARDVALPLRNLCHVLDCAHLFDGGQRPNKKTRQPSDWICFFLLFNCIRRYDSWDLIRVEFHDFECYVSPIYQPMPLMF